MSIVDMNGRPVAPKPDHHIPIRPITIVQGGQWGSEAKGMVAAHLAAKLDVQFAVRTGATNAGHTVYYNGTPYKMQQLPTAWVHMGQKRDLTLVVGAGALVDPEILDREISMCAMALGMTDDEFRRRVLVDAGAGVHLPHHHARAQSADRHHKMGATGKGCSEALIARISGRGEFAPLLRDILPSAYNYGPTAELLNRAVDVGARILLEGTQGTLLDLYHGPYPYVTHKQTMPAQWLMEAGLSTRIPHTVLLVCRTYPIRVAGNSGPMPGEIEWSDLAEAINAALISHGGEVVVHPDALVEWQQAVASFAAPDSWRLSTWSDDLRRKRARDAADIHTAAMGNITQWSQAELRCLFEMTTVTKKLRRIAAWDDATMAQSIMFNRPDGLIMTFMNYLVPWKWHMPLDFNNPAEVGFMQKVEQDTATPILAYSTGPDNLFYI